MGTTLGSSRGWRASPRLGCLWAVLVPALGVAAILLVPDLPSPLGGGEGEAGDPWTFAETLPQVTEDFGGGTRVLSISAADGRVTYELVGADGALHTRRYFVEVEDIQFPGPEGGLRDAEGRTRRSEDARRAATPAELRAATVTLSELDPGVVERMWETVGFPLRGSRAELSGRQWRFASGARPFDHYVARLDGTGVRQVRGREDGG